jgi:hypothetical protein
MKRIYMRPGISVVAVCILSVAGAVRADPVTDWNAIMQNTVTVAPSNPNLQTRWGAITQLAVYEAVNSIIGDYEPYLGVIDAPAWASPDAAAIAAAHRALITLRPDVAGALDAALEVSLDAIPDSPEKDAGITVGVTAADAILLLRENDGAAQAQVPYTAGTNPGDFQPIPPAAALLPGWGLVTPFGMESGSQFRLPAPPALHTGNYARDYEEVKLLGRIDSPFRPQDRTDVARIFAVASPVQVWNSAARQASAAQGKTLSQNARIFALLGMAMCDASIAGWDTKYHYNFWRPQAAIRSGAIDGNPLTEADPGWLPLITTPSHPSYASGHATVSGAARAVLEQVFGKDGHMVTLTHSTLPGIVLNYTAWDEITDDIDDARVYGGIHFRFDQEAGSHQGRHVGRYILRNHLRSPDEIDDTEDNE